MFARNRSGPRIDPRGDATNNTFKICFAVSTCMNVLLSIRKGIFEPCKIFVSYAIKFQFFSKMEWSTASNAFEKLIKICKAPQSIS